MALTVDRNNREIQAFPIHQGTFDGIATNTGCSMKVVHLQEDTDITFHFAAGDVVLVGQLAGMDFATPENCTGVTSTAIILIS